MAKIDIVQLDRELRQNKIRPFYIIVGTENYLALSSQRMIEASVKDKSSHESARTILEGKGLTTQNLLDSLQAIPLFGEKQLVIIKNAQNISKSVLDELIPFFSKPFTSSSTVLVATKLDGRSRFAQAAVKSPHVGMVDCKPLYPNQVPSWINMEMHRHKKQISQEAAHYLADLVGNDLGSLAQALEHITLFVGSRPTVELKDVEEAIAETTQRSVFELTDAIGNRNEKRSLAILKNLLDHGTSPVLILNMIARHFRILTKAKEIEGRSTSHEVANYLGVKPFFAKNYLEQSHKFKEGELKKKFGALSQCDRELKSSRIPKERILEKLILEL